MAFEFNKHNINDYDTILDENINTEIFTKLDNIEIIDENHPFVSYVRGFVHDSIKINIVHGWYNKETKTVKFLVGNNPSKYGDIIHVAWQKYWNNNYYEYNVSIYYTYCGELYKSDEYEVNIKNVYSKIMKNLIDCMANI